MSDPRKNSGDNVTANGDLNQINSCMACTVQILHSLHVIIYDWSHTAEKEKHKGPDVACGPSFAQLCPKAFLRLALCKFPTLSVI